jgi:hypothetical protein
VVFTSWKTIGDRLGEEAIDIAENLFVHLCRFAMSDATAEARLSHVTFAAYWDAPAKERYPIEVFGRWFPIELKAPSGLMPIDAAWFPFEVSAGESSRDVFDRVAAKLDEGALPRGWDGQVG